MRAVLGVVVHTQRPDRVLKRRHCKSASELGRHTPVSTTRLRHGDLFDPSPVMREGPNQSSTAGASELIIAASPHRRIASFVGGEPVRQQIRRRAKVRYEQPEGRDWASSSRRHAGSDARGRACRYLFLIVHVTGFNRWWAK